MRQGQLQMSLAPQGSLAASASVQSKMTCITVGMWRECVPVCRRLTSAKLEGTKGWFQIGVCSNKEGWLRSAA